jgi:hypothetical protein
MPRLDLGQAIHDREQPRRLRLVEQLTEALLLDQARERGARRPAFLDQTVGMRAQGGDRAADRHPIVEGELALQRRLAGRLAQRQLVAIEGLTLRGVHVNTRKRFHEQCPLTENYLWPTSPRRWATRRGPW